MHRRRPRLFRGGSGADQGLSLVPARRAIPAGVARTRAEYCAAPWSRERQYCSHPGGQALALQRHNKSADGRRPARLAVHSEPSGKKTEAILGFDALRAGAFTQWSEFALFRMAFDAIANAVDRVVLEQEKERLEVNLQQARRMETLGAFASGIAHNFNNIVSAILGYTEMADTHVSAGSRSASNLAEIRHAGERARELVGQILTFGNRGAMPAGSGFASTPWSRKQSRCLLHRCLPMWNSWSARHPSG